MRRPTRIAQAAAAFFLALAGTAAAADPIMPLDQVRPGITCEGRSVVRGTTITSFDAEVVDIVGDAAGGARILVRVSGPAVDESGIGQGFSGSPLYCRGDDGVQRNAGAISAGVGDYGNKLALVTPIEEMLGASPEPPVAAAGRRLAGPLILSGLPASVVKPIAALARRSGHTLLAAPSSPTSAYPPPPLEPGASVAAGYSTGDLTLSAIGTVTYVDGDRLWAFGHALDGVGRRSLFLQDAYVYTVVPNPTNAFATSYKLASAGHPRGAFTLDSPAAMSGRLATEPPGIPLKVVGRDLDTGRVSSLDSVVASEFALGEPADSSALRLVGSVAVAGTGIGILGGTPSRQSGVMCMRIEIVGLDKPLRICNRYVGRGLLLPDEGGSLTVPVGRMLTDWGSAMDLIESYDFGTLQIGKVEVSVKMRRGLAGAQLTGVRAPNSARRGDRIRVRMLYRRAGGGRGSTVIGLRVPRSLKPGFQPLVVTGTAFDSVDDLGTIIFDGSEETEEPPTTVKELAERFGELRRWDGVRAQFGTPETPDDLSGFLEGLLSEEGGSGRAVYRDPTLRISGSAATALRIRR